MKLNIYILLILLLSFSVANAQESSSKVINNINISVSEITNEVSTAQNNETTLIENKELNTNQVIARDSDIRIYLNQKRNVQNINLLFPEFNKDQVV
jgi:hypothetical protein